MHIYYVNSQTAGLVFASNNGDWIEFPNIMNAIPNTNGKENNNTAPMINSTAPALGNIRDRRIATPKRIYPTIVSRAMTITDSLYSDG
jgi:hypothetical protein